MISIIIPLYNKESRISDTLHSVLQQTEQDFEIVVVNDGSTDHSVQIVNSFRDERIRLFNQENGGPSKARNTGMREANGDWIMFLDADDELTPDALSTFVSLIEKYPKDKCFVCNFYMDKDGHRKIHSFLYPERIIRQPFWAWSFGKLLPVAGSSVFHIDITRRFAFNENYRRYEDAEWLFRIMRENRIIRCPKPVMIYNLGSAKASKKRKDFSEDYITNMDLLSGSLGERLAKYQLFKQAEALYPQDVATIYPERWHYRELFKLKLLDKLSILFIRTDRMIKKVVYFFCEPSSSK